jgi:hypothetical protein
MSQLWGMLKNPALFVNSEIAGQIPLVPSSASRVRCVSDWYTAPLVVKEGSPRGEGTTGLTKPQCRINPEKRPLPLPYTRHFPDTVQKRHSFRQLARWHCSEPKFQLHIRFWLVYDSVSNLYTPNNRKIRTQCARKNLKIRITSGKCDIDIGCWKAQVTT